MQFRNETKWEKKDLFQRHLYQSNKTQTAVTVYNCPEVNSSVVVMGRKHNQAKGQKTMDLFWGFNT